jgi:hypothetical protein
MIKKTTTSNQIANEAIESIEENSNLINTNSTKPLEENDITVEPAKPKRTARVVKDDVIEIKEEETNVEKSAEQIEETSLVTDKKDIKPKKMKNSDKEVEKKLKEKKKAKAKKDKQKEKEKEKDKKKKAKKREKAKKQKAKDKAKANKKAKSKRKSKSKKKK